MLMMSLSQQRVQEAAEIAAREQAWVDARTGRLGVPIRLDGEAEYTDHWDLTAVFEVLEKASALQWRGRELTAWTHHDVTRHFAILRPGHDEHSDQIDLVASCDLDQMLGWAEQADGAPATVRLVDGTEFAPRSFARATTGVQVWAVTCPSLGCPPQADPTPARDGMSRTEAEAQASDHDRLHHGGAMTAEVTPVASAIWLTPVQDLPVAWEVTNPDGTVTYRGTDVELAEELYYSSPAGSHLFPAAPAMTGGGR